MTRIVFIFLLLFGTLSSTSFAYHIVGGDLTYKCLGDNEYEITMVLYRDCGGNGAEYDSPGNIAIYNDTLFTNLKVIPSGIEEIPADIYDPCFAVPTGVCVQKGYYKTTVTLPQNFKGYTVSYQRCCRNLSVRNIQTPDKVGTTITTTIPGALAVGCNSSPLFKNAPPLAICLGSDFKFDHGATDANGDSLVYRFCDPYVGGGTILSPGIPNGIQPIPATRPPYSSVPWSAGYSATNPFNLINSFTIDAQTGEIVGIPRQQGQYLYGICVEEYRNGIKIGESRREFQVNIVLCESNTEAIFNEPGPCSGMELEFSNRSITSRTFSWDFDMDNQGTITSTAQDPVILFPDTGRYKVRLIANPQYDCADTIDKEIIVYPRINPDFKGNAFACASQPNFQYEAIGEFESYTNIYWTFPNGSSISADTGAMSDIFSYDKVGKFEINVELTHGLCSYKTIITPEVLENPVLKVESRNLVGCAPLLVELENESVSNSKLITEWTFKSAKKAGSFSNNAEERWRIEEAGEYLITLITYTTEKCIDTLGPVSFPIVVYDSPKADFYLSDSVVSIFDPEIEVFSNASNASECELFVGSMKSETGCGGVFTLEKPGKYRISQVVQNISGCNDTLSKIVEVENEYAFFAPNSFTPNVDGRNEMFRPVVVGSKEYELNIRDRWGNIIFTSTDPKVGWEGIDTRTQELVPIGVYLYQAKVLDFTDEYHFYSGEVNLFR